MWMGPVPDGDWNELFKEERPKAQHLGDCGDGEWPGFF